MLYRKKPVVIEAMRVPIELPDGEAAFMEGHGRIIGWAMLGGNDDFHVADDHGYDIHTLEGVMHASPGDWIIKGVQGEFYPCKPDIFAATYDEVATT